MNDFNQILIEFEQYLEKQFLNFKKYKMANSFIYDIEESVIVLIEQKEEFSKQHTIIKEILNTINESEFDHPNIKIKSFCSKYIKEWVTYYPFNGQITEELKEIDKKKPSLKILNRYKKWKGYKVIIAGFQLEQNDKKGYALVKFPSIGGIIELREIGKNLLNAYMDFVIGNPCIIERNTKQSLKKDTNKAPEINTNKSPEKNANKSGIKKLPQNKKTITITSNFEFIIDETMAEILNERYIKKYSIDILRRVPEIPDLKGFWTSIFLKDKNAIPNKLLKDLQNNKFDNIGVINDIYTYNMKSRMPDLETLDKEYFYLSVVYADNLNSYDEYNYLSEDYTIKVGDKVLVNRAGEDIVALVTSAKYYLGIDAPFPVNRTKSIIKKIENDKELEKYGYKPEDFYYYKFYDEDDEIDEDDSEEGTLGYNYYIVTTLCDKEEIANSISQVLIGKKLVAGSQIYKVKSEYWWKGKIETKEEFKIEFRTRYDKINEIIENIKYLHNYQTPEISKTKIICLTEDMKNWIDESIK